LHLRLAYTDFREIGARLVHAILVTFVAAHRSPGLAGSRAHVQNLLAGKVKGAPPLPFLQLGRRKLIRRESLLRWLERAESQW